MPLPPFDDVSDERQMSLGTSIAAVCGGSRKRARLDHWLSALSTRDGIDALIGSCGGREFDGKAFVDHLGKDNGIAVPLLDLLVVRGVLAVVPGGRIRVCDTSALMAS